MENKENIEQTNNLKDLGKFEKDYKFAHLWDRCVYDLIYNPEEYVNQFVDLLNKYGVDKNSRILDTATGSGFPSLDMYERGYENIIFTDGSDDQIELFNEKAQDKGFDLRSQKVLWQELPDKFEKESFKALFCKASIWYAAGGWNQDYNPTKEETLSAIKDVLQNFYDLLEDGGVLYVDKFKDSEVDHKDTVGKFTVDGEEKELIFYTHREPERQTRYAQMLVKDVNTGEEKGLPNVTYDLKEPEFEELMKDVGFDFERPNLSEEPFFTHWLAIKNKKQD